MMMKPKSIGQRVDKHDSEEFAGSTAAQLRVSPKKLQHAAVPTSPVRTMGPNDFKLLCVIGQGTYGKVIQVCHIPTGEIYAMKIVGKDFLVEKKTVSYMKTERDIMTKVNHPFLIRLKYAFQTDKNVYLVMPCISGGELFHHLQKQCMILEDAARFYAAEMVLALEHLHAMGIIHRDLKPENILLQPNGHIILTDFGLAKEMTDDEESATTICGTNEYMAPEMIKGLAYHQAVDWWALGALVYEMVTGKPPFTHRNKKTLHNKILREKVRLPSYLDSTTHSFIKQLLERNVEKRLGSGKSSMFKIRGVKAIKSHPFFNKIDWTLLAQCKVEPPLIPVVKNATDTRNFDEMFTEMSLTDDNVGTARPRLFSKFSFSDESFALENKKETC